MKPTRRISSTIASLLLGGCSSLLLGGCVAAAFLTPANAQQSDVCANLEIPAGAKALGYTRKVLCEAPSMADLSTDSTLNKFYTGMWYNKTIVPLSLYGMDDNVMYLQAGAGLITESRQSTPGMLPLLSAGAGFYVEFSEWLSDNDPDHWPAVWLMPQEHDLRHNDHAAGDPAGFERWMEIDVDEGGFNAGHHGAMIYWSGLYPHYEKQQAGNDPPVTFGMDRTVEHVFGLSYDPHGKKMTWWVDGKNVGSVSTANNPAVIDSYHYYLLVNNQEHAQHKPYKLYIRYLDAWSTAIPPKAPSGVQATVTNP